ncbi:uncharacterized protein K452DRAFT_316843 [Aplosporella prunicola CBS 121167]|uniref:Mitochondrial GTPase 1 n=1 Tax=Aplosporella prunicola CBS 121167 TaxID=1176127 RepID=A0A6A6BIX9_9PEZI|nr:uncharacterized protein K452DRAFT_316843 [Aplosporella prunicola CBS 121167]KAF2144092.1 hypothetical protein K452DRAFT_316843 [Aplosporella prunicola CBS 121167]
MASHFLPRAVFPTLDSLPRSYFLGHHRAGLTKMKTLLSSIDLIIECRDYRVPLTSRNPLFEESLAGRERLIIYTKKDLGRQGTAADAQNEQIIRQWHAPAKVYFSDHRDKTDVRRVLKFAKEYADHAVSLVGFRMMIVGMPNVGKSSLLNALRLVGVGKGKAAHTGAQPGVTRKIGSGVKIIMGEAGTEGVYLVDTPGVFVPYMPNAESMLKLALCGSVKDTIIPPTTLADYLLFHINKIDPTLYAEYHEPTNEVIPLLEAIARKTGRLGAGAVPDTEAAALWMIQRWRTGHIGHFILDEVSPQALQQHKATLNAQAPSMNQAIKVEKERRRVEARRIRSL